MKTCPRCQQPISEAHSFCPACGHALPETRKQIGPWIIDEVISEGHHSILYRVYQQESPTKYVLRLFKPDAPLDEARVQELKSQLEVLSSLPADSFIRHFEIGQSEQGEWFRRSEWFPGEDWPTLFAESYFQNPQVLQRTLRRLAEILGELHAHGFLMPYLILPDILLQCQPDGGEVIKIDFKGSRFLQPGTDQPGSLQQQLLDHHPDLQAHRALDERSDVWSLGKVFVEIISGKMGLDDPLAALEHIEAPARLKVLCQKLLEPDPDCRLQSVQEVIGALQSPGMWEITQSPPEPAALPARSSFGFRAVLGGALVLCALGAVVILYGFNQGWWHTATVQGTGGQEAGITRPPDEACVRGLQSGVALVAAAYWLDSGGKRLVQHTSEGSAFLIDPNGQVLTNRHVACPWLYDKSLYRAIEHEKREGRQPTFGYRLALWFHGTEAFKGGIGDPKNPWSAYNLEQAYLSDGRNRIVAIVAAPAINFKPSTEAGAAAALDDDVALLAVQPPPPGVTPLPLAGDGSTMAAGNKVYALGFPLGHAGIPDSRALADLKSGEISRLSRSGTIQLSVPLHPGNSGGPVIGENCKVIGIATGIQRIPGTGQLAPNLAAALSIERARPLLQVRAQPAAAYLPPVGGESLAETATKLAVERKWQEAVRLAELHCWTHTPDADVLDRPDALYTFVDCRGFLSLFYFLAGDGASARTTLKEAQSTAARIMAEDKKTRPEANMSSVRQFFEEPLVRCLFTLCQESPEGMATEESGLAGWQGRDWRFPGEFYAYAANLLAPAGEINPAAVLGAAETAQERAVLALLAGRRLHLSGKLPEAREVLTAGLDANLEFSRDNLNWILLLMAELDQVHKLILSQKAEAERPEYAGQVEKYWEKLMNSFGRRLAGSREIGRHKGKVSELEWCAEAKDGKRCLADLNRRLYRLLDLTGDNYYRAQLAYTYALSGNWQQVDNFCREFIVRSRRESPLKLSMPLLQAEALAIIGKRDEALYLLNRYAAHTADPWYRDLARGLLGGIPGAELADRLNETGQQEKQIAYLALGLWAEGQRDPAGAQTYYAQVLQTNKADTFHYALAKSRIKKR